MLSPYSYERFVYRRPVLQAALDRMVERLALRRRQRRVLADGELPLAAIVAAGVSTQHNIEYDILYRTYKAEDQRLRGSTAISTF